MNIIVRVMENFLPPAFCYGFYSINRVLRVIKWDWQQAIRIEEEEEEEERRGVREVGGLTLAERGGVNISVYWSMLEE